MAVDTEKDLKSLEERDREWLERVYRGDKEKDLTPRAVLVGMLFGGLMSLSNLYVGLKSGWGLDVGIAAIIVSFSLFKGLQALGLVRRQFGMMESTMTMTVSVAASWLSSAGLVSAVPALTMLTGYQFVWWRLTLLLATILYLGIFVAIPLKRQMIQIESLRFPVSIPCGETLKAMYSHGGQAVQKAKSLGLAGCVGMLVAGFRDGFHLIPAQLGLPLRIGGVSLSKLTLTLEPSLIFIGMGALFGMKVGMSMLLGVIVNYGILAPHYINGKVIHHAPPQVQAVSAPALPLSLPAGASLSVVLAEANAGPELSSGTNSRILRYAWSQPAAYDRLADIARDLSAPVLKDGSPNPLYGLVTAASVNSKTLGTNVLALEAPWATNWEAALSIPTNQPPDIVKALGFKSGARDFRPVGGFRNISAWSLWPGATVLVVGGLLMLAFQWRTLGRTFAGLFAGLGGGKNAPETALSRVEVPMLWFVIGFVVTGTLAAALLVWLFAIHWYMGVLGVVLSFFLAAVAARALAETSINPLGALGKVTQLTYGVVAPGNIPASLMTACVTAGAACSCGDTIGNLKVGHMVGANPRKQLAAQLCGVLAGAFLAVPAYFVLVPDANTLGGEKFPAPSALVWMGVAKVLSQGIKTLPPSAVTAMAIAAALGVVIVLIDRLFPKLKPYTPSPTALGISLTIPGSTSVAMFLGALIVWILERAAARWNDLYTVALASGGIAGESIMGVILAVLAALGVLK